jgi:hypothetical protein
VISWPPERRAAEANGAAHRFFQMSTSAVQPRIHGSGEVLDVFLGQQLRQLGLDGCSAPSSLTLDSSAASTAPSASLVRIRTSIRMVRKSTNARSRDHLPMQSTIRTSGARSVLTLRSCCGSVRGRDHDLKRRTHGDAAVRAILEHLAEATSWNSMPGPRCNSTAPQVIATPRTIAVSLHCLSGATNIAAACRQISKEPDLALLRVR